MGDILKEAIAEAKYVRQVAYENAKAQLTEAFDPKIKSAISNILQKENEDFDADDVQEKDDEEVTDEFTENIEEADVMADMQTKDDKNVTEPFKEGLEMEEDDPEVEPEVEPEMDDEEDLEIESILDELDGEDEEEIEEPELGDETPNADAAIDVEPTDEPIEEPTEEPEDEVEEQVQDLDVDGVQDDEEINIDELLNSLDEEEYPGQSNSENKDKEEQNVVKQLESVRSQNSMLKKKLAKYDKTVNYLQKQLSEVNLLNTKLLFTTKLFKNYKLTNESKTKIVEQFDRTKNIREVKLVYATLHESLKTKTNVKTVKEALSSNASRVIGGTQPIKQENVLTEGSDLAKRLQKLAGIIK